MSRGCLTRVLACAQNGLDAMDRAVLHSLWRDAILGALVNVRVALKFEVPASHFGKGAGAHVGGHTCECYIIRSLWRELCRGSPALLANCNTRMKVSPRLKSSRLLEGFQTLDLAIWRL